MRGLHARLEPPSMTLIEERVDFVTAFKQALGKALSRVAHLTCPILHGGHELYRAHTDVRVFQQCLLCGYETKGWTIDRRDRKLHLVSGKKR